jgi:hypothetical protein
MTLFDKQMETTFLRGQGARKGYGDGICDAMLRVLFARRTLFAQLFGPFGTVLFVFLNGFTYVLNKSKVPNTLILSISSGHRTGNRSP